MPPPLVRVPDAVSFNWRLHELPSIKKDTGIDVPKPTYAYNVVTLSYVEETPKSQLCLSVAPTTKQMDQERDMDDGSAVTKKPPSGTTRLQEGGPNGYREWR